jgi:hypothetical protein
MVVITFVASVPVIFCKINPPVKTGGGKGGARRGQVWRREETLDVSAYHQNKAAACKGERRDILVVGVTGRRLGWGHGSPSSERSKVESSGPRSA